MHTSIDIDKKKTQPMEYMYFKLRHVFLTVILTGFWWSSAG